MSKYSLILILALTTISFCNGYENPKTKLRFDANDMKLLKSSSHVKRRIVRGVFFYTYDDNFNGREIEMHELSLDTFNKLISSKDFTKSPAAIKSTFDLVSLFDGRCEATISCERIKQECTSKTSVPLTKPTNKILTFVNTTPIISSIDLTKNRKQNETFTEIFINNAPRIRKPDINEIKSKLKHVNEYTSHWIEKQVLEVLTPVFKIIKIQNTPVLTFSDEFTTRMLNTISNIDPNLSSDLSLDLIRTVQNTINIIIRDVEGNNKIPTSVAVNNVTIHPVSTSKPSTTTKRTTIKTTKLPETTPTRTTRPTTTTRSWTTRKPSTTRSTTPSSTPKTSTTPKRTSPVTTTSKATTPSTTTSTTTLKTTTPVKTTSKTTTSSTTISTSTTKPSTSTKTYIPPPASSRKPYTRWVGSYRRYTGQYSFGYSWKPFTGGNSWITRRYSTETTTIPARYRQESLEKSFNPIGNSK